MADITMPQLGETVTEGTITRWFKNVGDQVQEDEVLFEVSTDKVDSEVPSPTSGVLTEIKVQEGETVDVGTTLAVISADGASAAAAPAQEEAPAPAAEAPAPEAQAPAPAEAEPAPEPPAPDPGPSSTEVAGGQPTAAPVERAPSGEAARSSGNGSAGGDSRLLSPVVRRLIAEHALDPNEIQGTGAGGRITRNDVLAKIESGGGSAPAPAPAAAPQPAAATATQAPARPAAPAPQPAAKAGERDEVVPFTNIRRRTAEHMVRSKATSAHTMIVTEVDYENVDKVRLAVKDEFKQEEGVSLTYLPFTVRAVVDAIREFPHVNASVGEDSLIVHHDIHIGIAVDLNFEGLVAPVIHNADGKRLRAIAREIADLAARARSKKLGPDEISGGTFTITNAGPFGTLITGAIINQPQVAILATDGVKKRPVVVELPDGSDAIAIHPVGNLAITFDHRAFDGAYAAAFVQRVKEILETRDWAAELS
jgi:pyruvate dehydrogenase E2 component (dihydrolipoamide acetyltransferase)